MKIRKDGIPELQGGNVTSFTLAAKSAIPSTAGVQLLTANTPAALGVQIKAALNNSGLVYVGNASGVTAGTADANDGMELGPGESMLFPVSDANKLWLIASPSGQKIFYGVF